MGCGLGRMILRMLVRMRLLDRFIMRSVIMKWLGTSFQGGTIFLLLLIHIVRFVAGLATCLLSSGS